MRKLIAARTVSAVDERAQRRHGKTNIEDRRSTVRAAVEERLDVVAAVVGIEQGLRQPPGGETQESAGKEHEQKLSEWLWKDRARHVFGIDGSVVSSNGCQRGEGAQNQEHHSTRRVADPGHPFPHLPNKSLNLAVMLQRPGHDKRVFAIVPVPAVLPRFVFLSADKGHVFTPLETVIRMHLPELFPGMELDHPTVFRVTRAINDGRWRPM